MSKSFSKLMQQGASWVTAAVMVSQPQLLLAEVTSAAPTTSVVHALAETAPQDVALQAGGVLTGQVVDTAGQPQSMVPVSVRTGGQEIARVTTDQQGQFRVASLKGGVYHVATNGNQGVYRFWAPQTAPPASTSGLNLVSGQDVMRGQMGGGPFTSMGQWIAEHPIITAGAIATAIAVPIALSDDDDPSSP